MLEPGEDLPLAQEAAQDLVRVHAALDEFEGDALLEVAVGALGEPDGAHAAAAQLFEQAVATDDAARDLPRLRTFEQVLGCKRASRVLEEVSGRAMGPEQ